MSNHPVIAGFDISPNRVGWALVSMVNGRVIAANTWMVWLPRNEWRQSIVYDRMFELGCLVRDEGTKVAAIYIEQPALPFAKAAYLAGRAVQAVVTECQRNFDGADIQYLQPTEWRHLIGLKGNASKIEVAEFAETLAVLPSGDGAQDCADAVCVALAGHIRNLDVVVRAAARDR